MFTLISPVRELESLDRKAKTSITPGSSSIGRALALEARGTGVRTSDSDFCSRNIMVMYPPDKRAYGCSILPVNSISQRQRHQRNTISDTKCISLVHGVEVIALGFEPREQGAVPCGPELWLSSKGKTGCCERPDAVSESASHPIQRAHLAKIVMLSPAKRDTQPCKSADVLQLELMQLVDILRSKRRFSEFESLVQDHLSVMQLADIWRLKRRFLRVRISALRNMPYYPNAEGARLERVQVSARSRDRAPYRIDRSGRMASKTIGAGAVPASCAMSRYRLAA